MVSLYLNHQGCFVPFVHTSLFILRVGPTRELIQKTATVPLQSASRTVTIARFPSDLEAPGVPFAVTAGVSSVDGSALDLVPVSITLSSIDFPYIKQQSCNIVSGVDDLRCQMRMITLGNYSLTACTADGSDKACSTVFIGRNASSWQATPLSSSSSFDVMLSNSSHVNSLGDIVFINAQVPRNRSSILLIWGNNLRVQRKVFSNLGAGGASLQIKVGAECVGGCSVMALLSSPRAPLSSLPRIFTTLPRSKLFDPLSPIASSSSLSLNVALDQKLNLALKTPRALTPGSTSTLSVRVYDKSGAPAPPGSEVTFIAVDKSYLDLLPYPLSKLDADMSSDSLAAALSQYDVSSQRVTSSAILSAFTTALQRSNADPWITPGEK